MPAQTAQAINDFVAQPINNLLVFLAMISVGVVLLTGFTVYKFGPAVLNIMKSLAATLSALQSGYDKLVEMKATSLEWDKKHAEAIEDTNREIIGLRKNIKERSELDGQAIEEAREDARKRHDVTLARFDGIDLILVDISKKVEALPNTVNEAKQEILAEIKKCRETGTQPIVTVKETSNVVILPANVTPDDGQAKEDTITKAS